MERRMAAPAPRLGLFKHLALVALLAVLCPCAASSPDEVAIEKKELPEFVSEGEKEDIQEVKQEMEHETQEKVKTSQDICISMMLLGCMGFMMANFYLINWPDEDIKRISWEVISSTVSIFSAVLLFQAVNKVLEYYILEDMWIWYQLVVDMVHMALWFLILQVTLAYFSGAVGEHTEVSKHRFSIHQTRSTPSTVSITDSHRLQRQQSAAEHMEAIEANVASLAVLLGHITGFAAINAWGTLQQAVPRTLLFTSLVPVLAFYAIYRFYTVTDEWREHQAKLDDGEEDEFEKLWDEEVGETEDDVMALAVSFLVVQVLRFYISGELPNAEGEDPEGTKHSTGACGMLLLAALGFGCFEIIKITGRKAWASYRRRSLESQHFQFHDEVDLGKEHRSSAWLRDITAMCTAWCIHFSVDWYLTTNLAVEGAVSAVICAVAVTCLALGLIFVLDLLADMDFTDDEVDNALRALIASLGILIGFSWERSFDSAVGGLAEQRAFGLAPPVITLLLALILASMVIPAWKWYILPTVLRYKKESHHHEHEEHGEHKAAVHDAEAPAHSNLSEPLLSGQKEVSFKEDAEAAEPASAPQTNGMEEAQHQKMEAMGMKLAELQAALAAKEQEVQEASRSTLALKESCAKAQQQNSDLQAACERAHEGARLHADRAVQLEGSLQEKDHALQQKTAQAAALQEESSRLVGELGRLQKSAGEQAALASKLQAVGDQAHKLQELEQQRDQEMLQVRAKIADSEATAKKWEQRAAEEAQRNATLEASLRQREQQLDSLKAQKDSEIDHMSAVATERDRELRQLQAAATGQDTLEKLQAANKQLQQLLDNANKKASESMDQQMSLLKDKEELQAEVQRLQQISPSKAPRASPRTTLIPGTMMATALTGSNTSLPGAGGTGVATQAATQQPYTPAPFALPAFTWSAQCPPGAPPTMLQPASRVPVSNPQTPAVPTPAFAVPQYPLGPATQTMDRASYPQPTWPTTTARTTNPQLPPGTRLV